MDPARCFTDASSSATGQEIVIAALGQPTEMPTVEPALLPDILTAPSSTVREPSGTPEQSNEVFEGEVADIAQVHCDNDLFEFELTDHSPSVCVKGKSPEQTRILEAHWYLEIYS